MAIIIRPITSDEAELYVELRLEMLQESPRAFGASVETDAASDLEGMRARLESQGENRTFGAFDSDTGELLGSVGVARQGPHQKRAHALGVWGMYVAPRGARARHWPRANAGSNRLFRIVAGCLCDFP